MSLPRKADFAKASEVLVTGLRPPDQYGQSSWVAYWLSDNEWRGGSGIQGQHFAAANFDAFKKRVEDRGGSVRLWETEGSR